jgi:ABC-type Fe3+-hydroxamate transport system substrate-binding protein
MKNAVQNAGGKAIWTEAEGYQVSKEPSNIENLPAQEIDVLFIDACGQVASAPAIKAANTYALRSTPKARSSRSRDSSPSGLDTC